MTTSHTRRSGAQVLIDQLRIHGTDTIFGVLARVQVRFPGSMRSGL